MVKRECQLHWVVCASAQLKQEPRSHLKQTAVLFPPALLRHPACSPKASVCHPHALGMAVRRQVLELLLPEGSRWGHL